MRSRPVLPVITGNMTTRKRSTTPALSSDLDNARLPRVVMLAPSCFIADTASAASPLTRRVLAQGNGAFNVDENTTLGSFVSPVMALSSSVADDCDASDWLAKPYIRRYVFAP